MGKRKRDETDENAAVVQKIDRESDNITNCDDVTRSLKKKKKHKRQVQKETINGEMLEVQRDAEDAKNTKTKKRKPKDQTQDVEPTTSDQPVDEEESRKVKRKKHKHKKEIESFDSPAQTGDHLSCLQEDHKEKRKKHKCKKKLEEDVTVGEMLETNSEVVKGSKKKRKQREKDEETADRKDTDEVEMGEMEIIPKKKKKRKHHKEEKNNVSSEVDNCQPKGKDRKVTVAAFQGEISEEVEEKGSRDGMSMESRDKLKEEWRDMISLKKLRVQQPKMFLINNFTNDEDNKTTFKPVEMHDLQDLLQISVMGNASNINQVRFCKLVRSAVVSKVVLMVLNGVSDKHFQENKDCFPHLTANYDLTGQILNQELQQKLSVLNQLLYVAISKKELKKRAYVAKHFANSPKVTPTGPAVVPKPAQLSAGTKRSSTPGRTHYLLKDKEMTMWRYPRLNDPAYTHTKHNDRVSDNSPLVSVDCEMCVTRKGSELTRVSLVDEKYNVLYNSLVKPRNPIIDYVTRYSGITKALLDPVTTRIEDVQRDIIALLPADAILVGQSLENDLRALKLYHPHVIDTSNLFTGSYRVALRKLAWKYLGITIQAQDSGHDSIEDAVVTLKLLHLKLEKGESLEKYMSNTGTSNTTQKIETVPTESLFRGAQSLGKVSMLVDSLSAARQFMKDPVGALACQTDSEALKKTVQAVSYSDFVCVQFYNFFKLMQGTSQEGAVVKETLTQLDRRIKKIYKTLPFNSLFLVVMARDPNSASNQTSNIVDKLAHGRFFVGLKVKY